MVNDYCQILAQELFSEEMRYEILIILNGIWIGW